MTSSNQNLSQGYQNKEGSIIEGDYTLKEEIIHGITHGIGTIASIVGLVFLLIRAITQGTVWHIVSFAIYGASLILLYLASTLYHSIQIRSWKITLKKLDHSAIFLLIAGTYTPFLLTTLRGTLGWVLFGIIWGLAIIGLVIKLGFIAHLEKASLVLYLAMGWLVVVAMKQLITTMTPATLILLLVGGLAYTVGVIFYVWRKLPYNHSIWHVFVMVGSVAHYFSVINILRP